MTSCHICAAAQLLSASAPFPRVYGAGFRTLRAHRRGSDLLIGEDPSDLWESAAAGDTSVTDLYGEVLVVMRRAVNAAYASRSLEDELEAFKNASQSSSVPETGNWSKFSGNIGSAFYWRNGNWV